MIYVTPSIELVEIEMENGIAADSTASAPQVDDWQDGGSGTDGADF
ncbi:MAG TPA: hypothetical protein VKZ57_11275 [Sphingobacterium sp.]|nr:hypothetical protein [Sphingobacterium sp.]